MSLLRLLAVAASLCLWGTAAIAQPRLATDTQARLLQLQEQAESHGPDTLREIAAALAEPTASEDAALQDELRVLQCMLTVEQSPSAAEPLAQQGLARAGLSAHAAIGLQLCLGVAQEYTGQPQQARRTYESALTQARAEKLPLREAESLGYLADLMSYAGELVEAARLAREALAVVDAASDQRGASEDPASRAQRRVRRGVLQQLGNIAMRMDDGERAISYYQPLLEHAVRRDLRSTQVVMLYNIGRAYEEMGRFDDAWKAQSQSLQIAEGLGDSNGSAWSQRSLGAIRVLQGRYDEAMPHLQSALDAFIALDDAELVAQLKYYRARVWRARGDLEAAESDLRASIDTFRANRTIRFLDRALYELALVRQQRGANDEALRLLLDRDGVHRQHDEQVQDTAAARLRAEFDYQQQAQENRRLDEQQRWQAERLQAMEALTTQQYLIILLAAVIALIVASYAYRQWRVSRQMRLVAMTDELTQLPNRRAIVARGEAHWRSAQPTLSVLMIDIDHFKKINDQHGHASGDRALQLVAQACKSQLREGDYIGRIGGEEFLVLLPGAGAAVARRVGERLREAVAGLHAEQIACGLALSISLGAATREAADASLHLLMQRGDRALYQAKHEGRNRVVSDEPANTDRAA